MYLFSAARKELVDKEIIPALENETLVILDRYIYSTIAYQGYGRNIDFEYIHHLNKIATSDLKPDIVFLLDMNPEISSSRIDSKKLDRIESESIEFYTQVRNGYLEIAEANPKTWLIVDASKQPEQIHNQIWDSIH